MRYTFKTAVAAIAFVAGLCSTANGQTGLVRVAVPFDFHACDQALAAGTYEFRTDALTKRVHITSVDRTVGCYEPMKAPYYRPASEWSRVAFNTYGSAHFLARVQTAGAASGMELFPSAVEKELAKAATPREVALLTTTRAQ